MPITSTSPAMGTKRNRFLIRQPRIKRDSDTLTSQPSPDIIEFEPLPAGPLLTVPPRIERHASEPAHAFSPAVSTHHLLSVQSTTPYLVKQHSHPLLPSQQTPSSAPIGTSAHFGFGLHRQFSHPHSSTTETLFNPTTTAPIVTRTMDDSPININPVSCSPSVTVAAANLMHFVTTTSIKQESESPARGPPSSSVILLSEGNVIAPTASSSFDHAPTLRVKTEELHRSVSSPQTSREVISLESPRSSHCPVVRQGPALGCNFCWNTIDGHGRILRRKTKYHCPECQTNLCIVPCFQEYHERKSTENPSSTDSHTNLPSATGVRTYSKTEST